MRRRQFIGLLAATVGWPLRARGQQSKKPRIGILWHAGSSEEEKPYIDWVREGFTSLGYIEGRNIAFEERFPNEQPARFAAMAGELASLNVDVIVAVSTPSALAAQKATSTIPIVFLPIVDPVGLGLVATLARPGGNITGLSSMGFDVIAKRVQFFKEAVPHLSSAALLMNPSSKYDAEKQELEYSTAARKFNVKIERIDAKQPSELETAFADIKRRGFEGVFISQTPMYFIEAKRIAALAIANGVPTMAPADLFVKNGALLSYAAEWRPIFTGVGTYVKKILEGERPSEIPVQQPTRFELVVNQITAKALGLQLSPMFLAQADSVIE
jgi:putative tryptophan/tyrosine transport system substrate-binding protein